MASDLPASGTSLSRSVQAPAPDGHIAQAFASHTEGQALPTQQQTYCRTTAAGARRPSNASEAGARQQVVSVRRATSQRGSPEQLPAAEARQLLPGSIMFRSGAVLERPLTNAAGAASQEPHQLLSMHRAPAAPASTAAAQQGGVAWQQQQAPPDGAATLSPPSLEALGCSGPLQLAPMQPGPHLNSAELEIRELTLPPVMVRFVSRRRFEMLCGHHEVNCAAVFGVPARRTSAAHIS